MAQLAHTTSRAIAREGACGDLQNSTIVTRFVDEANGVKPGRFVAKEDDGDKHVGLPDASGDVTGYLIQGVSLLDEGRDPLRAGTNGEYLDNEPLPVLRKGTVWMLAEDAVSAGGAVFCRHTAAGAEELGRVRSDADTSDAVAVPGCVFLTSTSGTDELVLVEVNLPHI